MKYCIVVYSQPNPHEQKPTPIRFIESAIRQNHEIYRVFFYGDGIFNADDRANAKQWQTLQRTNKLDLVVCVTAALKRGLISEEEANGRTSPPVNVAGGFELAGLGQLADAAVICDRVITFR